MATNSESPLSHREQLAFAEDNGRLRERLRVLDVIDRMMDPRTQDDYEGDPATLRRLREAVIQ